MFQLTASVRRRQMNVLSSGPPGSGRYQAGSGQVFAKLIKVSEVAFGNLRQVECGTVPGATTTTGQHNSVKIRPVYTHTHCMTFPPNPIRFNPNDVAKNVLVCCWMRLYYLHEGEH